MVTQWAFETKATRIMVIDDEASRNEDLKASMRLSKPAGTSMSIIDTEKATKNFLNGNYSNQRVLIVVKEPGVYLALAQAGVEIPGVDLGIMFFSEGKKKLSSWIALDDAEQHDIHALQEMGIPVYLRYTTSDSAVPVETLL